MCITSPYNMEASTVPRPQVNIEAHHFIILTTSYCIAHFFFFYIDPKVFSLFSLLNMLQISKDKKPYGTRQYNMACVHRFSRPQEF